MGKRAIPPIWVMGLAGATYGIVGGFVAFTLAQTLAARHVPEPAIATITGIAMSPGFWGFLLSPMLDVRFSRRTYALLLMIVSALLTSACVFLFDRLALLEVTATAAFLACQLYYGALGGWLCSVCGKANENRLSAWLTVGNVGGFGLMAIVGGEVLRNVTPLLAAALLAMLTAVPALSFIGIPAPGPDRRVARESFQSFFADVLRLFQNRDIWFAIILFVMPCATFSLTNMLGGLGGDFFATPRQVGILGGAATSVAGVCGSLLLPRLAKRLRLLPLYLTIGVVGSLYTLAVLALPRDINAFALAVIGENMFQGLAIACSTAVAFEVIGQNNPLAATNFAVLVGAYNVPISYMLFADGWGYGRWNVAGAFAVDATLGITACLLMTLLSSLHRRRELSVVKQPA